MLKNVRMAGNPMSLEEFTCKLTWRSHDCTSQGNKCLSSWIRYSTVMAVKITVFYFLTLYSSERTQCFGSICPPTSEPNISELPTDGWKLSSLGTFRPWRRKKQFTRNVGLSPNYKGLITQTIYSFIVFEFDNCALFYKSTLKSVTYYYCYYFHYYHYYYLNYNRGLYYY
jgi:hypothetical protein